MTAQCLTTCMVTACLLARVATGSEPAVDLVQEQDKVTVKVGDAAVATYCHADPAVLRPYFAQVAAPGGIQVTRNQPPIEGKDPTDHPQYHPGIWLAFGDLGGGDFWRNRDRVIHETFVEPLTGGRGEGTFAVRNRYERANGTLVCRELCRYRFLVRPSGYLLLWDSTFSADKEFFFGDQEEMGLGVRVAGPLAVVGGGKMCNSHGQSDPARIWGKTADWCDYSGVIDGRRVGLMLMAAPANAHPSWFHARDYGLLVANLFGRKAFTQGEPRKIVIRPGESFRVRYGILLHADLSEPERIAAYDDFLSLLTQGSGTTH
jgi:hypothetical protein